MPRGLARDHAEKRDALRRGRPPISPRMAMTARPWPPSPRPAVSPRRRSTTITTARRRFSSTSCTNICRSLAEAIDNAGRDGTAEARLRDTIRAILLEYEDADDAHKVQLETLDTLPPGNARSPEAADAGMVDRLGERLEAAAPGGLGERRRAVTMSVFGMLNWYYTWNRPGRGMDRSTYADLVTDLVLGGVVGLAPRD
jgi:hypothetical protein